MHVDGIQRVGRALTVWKSLELLTAIQEEVLQCGAVAHTCQSQVSKLKHSGSQLTAMIAIELDLHDTYEAVTWWKGLQFEADATVQFLEGRAVPDACKMGKSAFRSIQAVN